MTPRRARHRAGVAANAELVTDHSFSPPPELSERYAVAGEIGRGGMATVFRATDRRHGSDVAIKVLKPELVPALGGERFTREVRVTAALQHPHILPLLDSGEANGLPYYVMPFVSGASLAQRLEREGPLPIGEAVRYVAEIAEGLTYAHGKGLIHRDLKPANILLSQGHALLADFGIARVLDTGSTDVLTDSGLALGTAAYMSPEQSAGERVDARADIYALGCVLYELLTGTPPFTGSSQRAIMARHAMDPVPSVRTVRGEVPPALEAVTAKALAKTPGDRFADASEFRTAMLAAATSTAMPAARRHVLRRTGLTAGAAVVVGVAAFFATRPSALDGLNPNRVMVYPLVLPADWPGSRTAGEDASTMIGSAMDGAGSLRWLDGWQLLAPARRDDMRSLSDSEANALARLHRCRYVLTGRLAMRSGDSAEVLLSLRDLTTDSLVSRPRAVALRREPWRAGLRAVTAMLPTLIPGGGPNVMRDWGDRDPLAVAHFLAGEAAFRRVRLGDALGQFKAAVAADSSFGAAALRGAQAAMWDHRIGDAATLVRVATTHAPSPRERTFAAGLAAYLDGRADSAVTALRAALELDPEMTVAWMQLSETYLHLLPASGRTDSLAGDALTHATALDSSATNLLYHQVELAARAGDTARADSIARRFMALASDTMLRGEVELLSACASGRLTSAQRREAALKRPQVLLVAAKMLGVAHPRCMRDLYGELLRVDTLPGPDAEGRRWFELVGLHQVLLARGATDSAIAAIDAFEARWKSGTSLYLYDAPVVPALAARARRVAATDSARFGADFRGAPYTLRLWLNGVWAAVDGRVATAQAVAAELGVRAARDGRRADSVMTESLLAHVALARADTTDATKRFSALLHRPIPYEGVSWDEAPSLGLERLTLGRLLLARRQFAEARAVLEVLDSAQPAVFPLYAPAALRLRAEAAAALGDAAQAAALRARAARAGS